MQPELYVAYLLSLLLVIYLVIKAFQVVFRALGPKYVTVTYLIDPLTGPNMDLLHIPLPGSVLFFVNGLLYDDFRMNGPKTVYLGDNFKLPEWQAGGKVRVLYQREI